MPRARTSSAREARRPHRRRSSAIMSIELGQAVDAQARRARALQLGQHLREDLVDHEVHGQHDGGR